MSLQAAIGGRARQGILVFLVAFAVRLAAVWALGPAHPEFGDSRDYLEAGRSICARGDGPGLVGGMYFRPPGFPIFISLVTACHTEQIGWIKIALAAIDSLTVLLVWALARLVNGPNRVLWLVVAVAALNPIFVYQTADLRSEPLFMALLTGALLMLFTARGRRERLCLPLAGLLLGLAALTRPAALIAIPFFALAWIAGAPARRRREALPLALLLAVAAGAVVAPWTQFISARFDELILVNDTGGFNLWKGTHPDLLRALSSPDRATYAERVHQFELVTIPAEARAVELESDSPMSRSRAWRRRALDRIVADPVAYLKAILANILRFWRPWLSPMEHGPLAVAGSAALLGSIYLLGAIGIASIRKSQPWLFWFVLAWFFVTTLAHAPFQTVMRYRLPFTDPLLIAFMGGGAAALWSRLGRRSGRAVPSSGANVLAPASPSSGPVTRRSTG